MLWLTIALLSLVGCSVAEEQACTTHADGKYYDLSPLKANKDYEFKAPGSEYSFFINVCKTPTTETFGLKDIKSEEVGGIVRRAHGDFVIGKLNTTLSVQDSKPRLTLTDGSKCKSGSSDTDIRASTVIEFVCDTSVYSAGTPRLVAQLPPGKEDDACAFVIEWRTHVACATNEPGGAWGFFAFFFTTIISIALLYLVAGTLYNRFVLQLRGIDQLPQFSLESMKYHAVEAFEWAKDMIFVLRSNYGPSARPGYSRPNTEDIQSPFSGINRPSAGMNPVSHQTQVSGATPSGETNNQFVRPHISRAASAARGQDINPVSHQAQISASANQPAPHAPEELAAKKSKTRPKPLDIESQEHEREFMLGDEDDEGDEVVVQGSSQPAPEVARPPVQRPPQTRPSGNPST